MVTNPQLEEGLEKLARRGIYCVVMGIGAFLAYFNSIYGWVTPPEYRHVKGTWLEPVMPALAPHLPQIVIALGVGFLAYAVYCLCRYWTLAKAGR